MISISTNKIDLFPGSHIVKTKKLGNSPKLSYFHIIPLKAVAIPIYLKTSTPTEQLESAVATLPAEPSGVGVNLETNGGEGELPRVVAITPDGAAGRCAPAPPSAPPTFPPSHWQRSGLRRGLTAPERGGCEGVTSSPPRTPRHPTTTPAPS